MSKEYEELLAGSGLPEAILPVVAYVAGAYGTSSVSRLQQYQGRVQFSLNDSYIICFKWHQEIKRRFVVEIANPYVKEGYAFLTIKAFEGVVASLLEGRRVDPVKLLKASPWLRYDARDGQHNW